MRLHIVAYGTPRPQGSMRPIRANGGVYLKHSNTLAEWRNAVVLAARDALGEAEWPPMYTGGVSVGGSFYFKAPASLTPSKIRREGLLKVNGSDLDKLLRGVNDALVAAGVIADDKQIAHIGGAKYHAITSEGTPTTPRAEITVTTLKHEGEGSST